MRTTADIIDTLARDLSPAPPAYVAKRLAVGIASGAAVAAAITLGLWGPRPDFAAAVGTGPFWMKWTFTGMLALAGFLATRRLARPEGRPGGIPMLCLFLSIATLAGLAALQLAQAPAEAYRALVMGETAKSCPWLIMLLALPVFAGVFWAMRAMAPTRLARAGAAAGLTAGSVAALVYAVSCDESAAPFVLVWYGLGIAVPTMVGAAVGPRLLRW